MIKPHANYLQVVYNWMLAKIVKLRYVFVCHVNI